MTDSFAGFPSHTLGTGPVLPLVEPHWQTCPVCRGVGSLPAGFYTSPEGGYLASTARESCRSCAGQGMVR